MKTGINTLLIIIIGILIFAAVTNPTEEQFVNFLENKLNENVETKFEEFLNELLGKTILKTNTEREDYIVFSKFTVSHQDDTLVYIGIFKNFFIKIK